MPNVKNTLLSERKPKTVEVPGDLLVWFKEYVDGFRYRIECIVDCGMNERTIKAIYRDGTCAPETLERIQKLKAHKAA